MDFKKAAQQLRGPWNTSASETVHSQLSLHLFKMDRTWAHAGESSSLAPPGLSRLTGCCRQGGLHTSLSQHEMTFFSAVGVNSSTKAMKYTTQSG